jgi:hypothetical protein
MTEHKQLHKASEVWYKREAVQCYKYADVSEESRCTSAGLDSVTCESITLQTHFKPCMKNSDRKNYCTVRLLMGGHSQQNAQWIWCSPLMETGIVACVCGGYSRSLGTVCHPSSLPTVQLQPLPRYFVPYFPHAQPPGQVRKYGLYAISRRYVV